MHASMYKILFNVTVFDVYLHLVWDVIVGVIVQLLGGTVIFRFREKCLLHNSIKGHFYFSPSDYH